MGAKMTTSKLLKASLMAGIAPMLIHAAPAHAGPLSGVLTGGATKTAAPAASTVASTVGKTTTIVAPKVISVLPLSAKTSDKLNNLLSPVIKTVNGAPGSLVNTVNATGSILDNTTTDGLPYLLRNDAFAAPEPGDVEPKWGKIRSFWGKIRSFEGEEVSPFWGKIRSFWGDVTPFEGDTRAFWGDLVTYNDGKTPSSVNRSAPAWGKIRSFWDELGTSWAATRPAWDNGDYKGASAQLRAMVNRSGGFWGDAVKAGTGKDFNAGFANPLLAKYGIDLGVPASLAKLDVNEREHFFLEWYDGLMQFSGADNPDYWMRMVNWSPSLTQNAGEGRDSIIGLLDFTVSDPTAGNIKTYKGASSFDNGHGSAVASLMVAPHDGKGVMGIAPMATVVAYNPFDATETAGWADIKKGILTLGQKNASIINMSLGVPGWTLHPDWNSVLADPAVTLSTKESVFVIAAGNDGISQPQNIKWTNSANVIVVGSVDPSGAISDFSNRPGDACLNTNNGCVKLMDRFIVAPGEMMLVSDGKGGVTRYSGTSFAAPLVSGTIALIHDRWPWLAKYPGETIDIILGSATDLGAKGNDPVYGVGMLNVTGALSPLDYNNLTWYQMSDKGQAKAMSSATLRSQGATQLGNWEAKGMYFYAFENIGGTYRDFAIPLSSKLFDSKALSAGSTKEQFQAYLYNQVTRWMKTGASFTDRSSLNFTASSASVGARSGLNITLSSAPRTIRGNGLRFGQSPYQSSLRLASPEGRFALQMGEGDGAIELGNIVGFGRASDYDPSQGGANPILGMASGGAFGKVSYSFNDALSIAAGFTEQDIRYDFRAMSLQQQNSYAGIKGYRTGASTVSVAYRPLAGVELTGAYTRLAEKDGILGIQSLSSDVIGKGATTDGMTLGATWQATPTLQIAASATSGRTRTGSGNTLVATGGGGFRTSAYQVSIAKQHVFDGNDALRISMAQPLHVDSGSLDVSSVQVIDRETGQLGLVTERFDLPGSKRPLVGAFQYARSMMDGQADVALFGQARLRGAQSIDQAAGVLAGARFTLRY